jgi:hypothetical protein
MQFQTLSPVFCLSQGFFIVFDRFIASFLTIYAIHGNRKMLFLYGLKRCNSRSRIKKGCSAEAACTVSQAVTRANPGNQLFHEKLAVNYT